MSEEYVNRNEFNTLKNEVQELKEEVGEYKQLLMQIDKKCDGRKNLGRKENSKA